MKLCNQCGTEKPFSDWHKNKRSKDGFAFVCKSCAIENGRRWREGNADRHRANSLRLYASYKAADRPHADSKACPRCKTRKSADHFRKNAAVFDGLSTYCIECARIVDRERDPLKRAASSAASRKRNRDAINETQRKFYASNKEVFFANNRKRRALLKGASGSHSAADIADILAMQRYKCAYCKCCIRSRRHIDHITPLARGGSNDRANLQALCPECNLQKRAKDPVDYARSIGFLI